MGRGRDDGTIAFDVSFEADDSLADGGGPAAPPGPSGFRRAADRWRATSRRQRRRVGLVAGGVVVVVLGGLATTTAVAAHVDAQRLRGAPGGIVSLEGDLTETARVDVDGLAAVLPDGVLALLDGGDVLGWDVASGTEVWRTAVGDEPRCGPRPQLGGAVDLASPVELVTCVHDGGTRVTVLAADGGVVGSRDLPAAAYGREHQSMVPAADGGLLVVEHDTRLPERATFDDQWMLVDDVGRPATTASLHVEDALTGELRFEVPVKVLAPFAAADCYDGTSVALSGAPAVDGLTEVPLAAIDPVATAHLVTYARCGLAAGVSARGVPLPSVDPLVALSTGWIAHAFGYQVTPDGGFVVAVDGSAVSSVVGADGTTTARMPAHVLAPAATDGGPQTVLVGAETGSDLVAFDPGGEEAWRVEGFHNPSLVAQAGGAVLSVGWERIDAYEAADGAPRWSLALSGPDLGTEAPDGDWNPVDVVTDGARATLLVQSFGQEGIDWALLTVDLATGDHRLRTFDAAGIDAPASADIWGWSSTRLAAVDGRPVLLDVDSSGGHGDRVTSVATLGSP